MGFWQNAEEKHDQQVHIQQNPVTNDNSSSTIIEQIEKLAQLKNKNIIMEGKFNSKKVNLSVDYNYEQ